MSGSVRRPPLVLAVLVTALLAGQASVATAAPAAREKVFVTPVQGKLKPDVLEALFDLVLVAVDRADVLDKTTVQDVAAQVEHEKLKDKLGCNAVSCASEIAGALGVRFLLATSVKKLGGSLLVTMNLVDTQEQRSKTGQGRCPDREDEYEKAVSTAVKEVLGLVRRTLDEGSEAASSGAAGTTAPLPSTSAGRGPVIKRSQVSEVLGDLTVSARPKESVRLELTDPGGKAVVSGSPYKNPRAAVGTWRLVATAPGHAEKSQSFEVPADELTMIKVELEALGGLSVTGQPVGSSVTVTGPGGFKDTSGLPWEAAGLVSGTYELAVERPGYVALRRTVDVAPGEVARVEVALDKVGAGAATRPVPPPTGQPRVAVVPFVPNNDAPRGLVEELGVRFAAEAASSSRYDVLGPADLKAVVGVARLTELLGQDHQACATAVGEAVGATYVVTAMVSRYESRLILSLELFDPRTRVLVRRAMQSFDEKGAAGAAASAYRELFKGVSP